MNKDIRLEKLTIVFANLFALYLKTLNYHWHVSGENFYSLHQLFEQHYKELAEALDILAERIVALKGKAPSTFSEIQRISTLEEGNSEETSQAMIIGLEKDHEILAQQINEALDAAKKVNDEGTITLLGELLANHEKRAWMLRTSEC